MPEKPTWRYPRLFAPRTSFSERSLGKRVYYCLQNSCSFTQNSVGGPRSTKWLTWPPRESTFLARSAPIGGKAAGIRRVFPAASPAEGALRAKRSIHVEGGTVPETR